MPYLRQRFRDQKIPDDTANILMALWRNSTQKQYLIYHKNWIHFCTRRKLTPFHPTVNQVLQYLTYLIKQDLTYSTINTARSSLSVLLNWIVTILLWSAILHYKNQLMKCLFDYELRQQSPSIRKLGMLLFLGYLRSLHPTAELSPQLLILKLVMLVALTTAQRWHTLQALDVRNMYVAESRYHLL